MYLNEKEQMWQNFEYNEQVIAKLAKLVRNLELKQERLRAGFKERHKKEDNYQF